MKTRMLIKAALAQLFTVVLIWGASLRASAVRASAVDAVITDIKGMKTPVTGIRAHRHDSCGHHFYYGGIAREVDTDWDSIFLSVDDDRYRVEIPLDIIRSLELEQSPEKTTSSQTSQQWAVVLSDGTTLVGKPTTFVDFKAKAELGDYSIPWEGVSRIVFSSPKTTHQIKANGARALTLYLTESEKRTLTEATFIRISRNKNFCFVGFGYDSNVLFKTDGGAKYDITLDKIRELRFVPEAHERAIQWGDETPESIQLVSPSGTEYSGHLDALGVEGISHVGAFDLLVIVPFTSSAKRLTVDEKGTCSRE